MKTLQRPGRPSGLVLHTECFEGLLALTRWTKRDVAESMGITASTLSDLLAHRCGISRSKADRLASLFAVPTEALFPELANWVAPPVVRKQRRRKAAA